MASNTTQHYQLSQWEPSDKVERLDFNSDNAKIDEALKAAADLAAEGKALAQAAYGPENCPFSIGHYTGNGAETRVISLGFTPSAVLLMLDSGRINVNSTYYGGLALRGRNAATSTEGAAAWISGQTAAAIVEGGFQVSYIVNGPTICTNGSGAVYHYIAFR